MNNRIIKIEDLLKIFPKESLNEINDELRKTHTEWCLTKYMINDKKYVTINFKLPESDEIIYIDEEGERVLSDGDENEIIKKEYEQFIVERKYWYSN